MIITPVRKAIADIALIVWLHCNRMGVKTRVKVSHVSLSRTVYIGDLAVVRISDHRSVSGNGFDYEIVVWDEKDIETKKNEAIELLQRIVGGARAVAA